MKQREIKRQSRFSIRKLSTGICSLAIGHLIWLAPSMTVQVEATGTEQPNTETMTLTNTSESGNETVSVQHENIAVGKEVTSSGIEPNTQYTANLAFDNNPETRYSSAYMKQGTSADQTQTPQWLQVDLGSQAEISEIKIDFFRKVYATDYTVESSATGQDDWKNLATRQALAASDTTLDPTDTIKFEKPVTSDRYLRFNFKKLNHFAGGNGLSIKDIKVNGRLLAPKDSGVNEQPNTGTPTETTPIESGSEVTSNKYENIALGKDATSSGIEPSTSYTADLAFDNNLDTRYSSAHMKQGNAANQTQTPQWLQVDLGAQAELKEIKVDFFKKVYATDYTVETSATGQGDWKKLATRQELTASNATMDPTDTITFAQPVKSERYLRFNFNKLNHFAAGNAVSVKDIKVNGRLLAPIKKAINPIEKLTQAELAIENDKVVLTGIEPDDEYTYEVIGSDNEYVVDKQGGLSSYRLNDQDITLLVSARRKSDQSLVVESKQNKVVRVQAKHQETVQGTNVKPSAAIDIQEFLAGTGTTALTATDKVYIDPAYAKQVALFNEDLERISGFSLKSGSEAEAKVVFKLTDEYNLKDEGYLMRVNNDKVEVLAHNPKAFNYAAVTIAQLIQKDGALAQGVYRDYPNYAIRGMVLDVARIPMRTDFLANVSKLFRWYKLNEMHLHFNDNQWPQGNNRGDVSKWEVTEAAHRLESSAFPSLNKLPFKHDRYEGEYDFYRNVYGNPAYSLEEFKKFQKDNNDAGINILAEFDNPGHSAAYSLYALKNPDNIEYLGKPIHHPSDLEALAINEKALPEATARAKRFVNDLVSSYLDSNILTYDNIHLGVDEYWQKNGNIEAFRQYLNELAELAKSKGKTLRTWGALGQFNGTTPVSKDIVFDEWAQYESVTEERIKEGYKVVNVPQPFTYITPGRHHKDIINEQFVFENWHPTIFNLNHGGRKHAALKGEPLLLGAKGALWGDEHREGVEESDLYTRLEKSLSMIGFKTWNSNSKRQYLEYETVMEATRLKDSYRAMKTASEVLVHVDANHVSDEKVVDLSTNGHQVTAKGNVEVVELNNEKWFKFDGNSSLETDIETVALPYTVEMTIRPTDSNAGSLLFSRDGAIYLNKKGLKQDGTVAEGFMFNRYFYGQHISAPLEANRDYKLTFSATQQVLTVYLDGKKIATFAQSNPESTNIKGDFRTSFMLPFKEIGKGFKGYIKDVKVYNRTESDDEAGKPELTRKNIALHKPVYDFRHNSLWWDQGIRPYNRFKVTDGDVVAGDGRWNSSDQDHDYFIVDLEKPMSFSGLEVVFDSERIADGFKVSVSDDLKDFTEIYKKENNNEATVNANVTTRAARYVKFEGLKRKSGKNEMAIREFRLFSPLDSKETLRQAFAAKTVDVKNPTWVEIYNTLNNKFADADQIQAAMAKVATLADKAPEKEVTPDKDKAPEKEATPDKDKAPEKEATPEKDKAPEKEAMPDKDKAPEKEVTLDKDKAPEKEATLDKDKAPEKEATPDKDKAPEKAETAKHHKVLPENLATPEKPMYDLQADNDGDGYSNYVELVLGSNPENKESLPQVKAPQQSQEMSTESKSKGDTSKDTNAEHSELSKNAEHSKVSKNTESVSSAPEIGITASVVKGEVLPETGEVDYSLVFGTATMAILASIGLVTISKKEEL